MNDLKVRVIALILTVLLILTACVYSSCNRQQNLTQLEVALTDDGTRVALYVDRQGNKFVRYGTEEIKLIEKGGKHENQENN